MYKIATRFLPVVIVGLLPCLLELYSHIPARITLGGILPPIPGLPNSVVKGVKEVTILFPGFGGNDEHTERIVSEHNAADGLALCYLYDWGTYRGDLLRASNNGIEVGKKIGSQLANTASIEKIHVIGVSVGSFAADACVSAFNEEICKQQREACRFTPMLQPPSIAEGASTSMHSMNGMNTPTGPKTRATFLDPFTQKGLFRSKFGINHFGKSAEYAEQYLNTDDPVPSTNSPLLHAHCWDITAAKERETFIPLPDDNMHSWPCAFFGLHLRRLNSRVRTHKTFERGKTTSVI